MRSPASTYRLQIRQGFTLFDAAETVPYLRSLGVDWIYLSPILKAESGSDHGYDVTDPSVVDPERGGPEGLAAVSKAAHAAGMGVLIDIVPNHVGVASPVQNPWWWSLLKEGRRSPYADAFDVDWDFGGGKLRVPVLGSDDDLDQLEIKDGELWYYDHRFPLAEGTYNDGDSPKDVHGRQHYELIGWRRADNELNYRRFFAVNTLAGIRVEVPSVFDEAHQEVARWFRDGLADGLRIDHPDGLADPGGYLERLRDVTGGAYLLIEKILEPGEQLPASFECEGTTGYDALADVDRIFVDPQGREALDQLDARLRGGQAADYQDMIRGTKRRITDGILHSEILRLARLVPAGAGLPEETAADAIAEIIAAFPIYRTYLPEGGEVLEEACRLAASRRPELDQAIRALQPLLMDTDLELSRRFQQTSGMVMAKGVEDTAFFRFNRLGTLTEVGADPTEFALEPAEFHARMASRQADLPLSMTTLSTHDTKRSEDTRARIAVISEVAPEWERVLDRLNDLVPLPDGPFSTLLWQAIAGAWPASRERLHAYALKAAREAGNSTNWTDPDPAFEARAVIRRRRRVRQPGGPRRAGIARGDAGTVRGIQLALGKTGAADNAGGTRCVPGNGVLGPVADRSRQPAPSQLRRPQASPGPVGRRIPSRVLPGRGSQIVGHLARAADAPGPAGALHRLPTCGSQWSCRPSPAGIRPRSRGSAGHGNPASARTGAIGGLAGHRRRA